MDDKRRKEIQDLAREDAEQGKNLEFGLLGLESQEEKAVYKAAFRNRLRQQEIC